MCLRFRSRALGSLFWHNFRSLYRESAKSTLAIFLAIIRPVGIKISFVHLFHHLACLFFVRTMEACLFFGWRIFCRSFCLLPHWSASKRLVTLTTWSLFLRKRFLRVWKWLMPDWRGNPPLILLPFSAFLVGLTLAIDSVLSVVRHYFAAFPVCLCMRTDRSVDGLSGAGIVFSKEATGLEGYEPPISLFFLCLWVKAGRNHRFKALVEVWSSNDYLKPLQGYDSFIATSLMQKEGMLGLIRVPLSNRGVGSQVCLPGGRMWRSE